MSYADELGEFLETLVDHARAEGLPALLELAVMTAQNGILEIPGGATSEPLNQVANIRCGRQLADHRLRAQAQRGR